MAKDNNHSNEHSLFGKYFSAVLVICLLASVLLFLSSQYLPIPFNSISRQISMILFGAILVTILHDKVLGEYFQHKSSETIDKTIKPHIKNIENKLTHSLKNVEEKMINVVNDIGPEIKKESIQSIKEIKDKVATVSDFLLNGVGVLSGAKIAGIVNIFPTRYEGVAGEKADVVIAQDLRSEQSEIRIMGISLGDYFLDRGVHHNLFEEILNNKTNRKDNFKIRALIVHPKSETLKERARWEVGEEYYKEPTFFDSTTFIETDGAARIAKRLCEKYPSILSVKLYKQAPTAFILLTSRYVFFEPYHYAARGSNVPIFQVHANARLYKYYESHFERIWKVSESVMDFVPFGPNEKENNQNGRTKRST